MLLLGVALATLFHELAAPEVADEHQVVISYIKDKAPRVWCVDLRLGVKTGYPRRASFEVDDSAIMDFIFVYPVCLSSPIRGSLPTGPARGAVRSFGLNFVEL